MTLLILYDPCRDINLYLPCISCTQDSSPKYTKYYPCNFFEETSI